MQHQLQRVLCLTKVRDETAHLLYQNRTTTLYTKILVADYHLNGITALALYKLKCWCIIFNNDQTC